MAETSTIEWTDATWNPIAGCSLKSPGCANCYAMPTALRHELMSSASGRVSPYAGLTRKVNGKAVWTGELRLVEGALTLPLRWVKPKRIFVNSMSDLFHEDVPDAWIDRVFAVMALAPQHTFQVLTKRSGRMRAYFAALPERMRSLDCDSGLDFVSLPLPNVWLGVSAEDQRRADERVPDLLATPAAVRFVSAEPLLGPIDFTNLDNTGTCRAEERHGISALWKTTLRPRLDWIIAGSESGPRARPCDVAWVRLIRDQCIAADISFFWKQHVENGRKITLPEMDGRKWAELPHSMSAS